MKQHCHGERSLCRLCKREIEWRFVGVKAKPFDLDGTSHFLTCTAWRDQCRRRDEAKRAARDVGQGRLFGDDFGTGTVPGPRTRQET